MDLIKTAAERLAHEEFERAEKRRRDLAEQSSELNPPEKVHQLRLPADPTHPILDVIALGTRLTLVDVREEQRTRAARAANRTPE